MTAMPPTSHLAPRESAAQSAPTHANSHAPTHANSHAPTHANSRAPTHANSRAPTHDARTTRRVEEMAQRFPSHTPLMLVLSFGYLVLALAFVARLLDTSWAGMSEAQLGRLINWSETLFGCAVALGLWGACVLPWLDRTALDWRPRWVILVCAGVAGLTISVAMHRAAVGWLTDDPTGQMGRKAAQLNLLAYAARDARIPIPELQLEPDRLASPAGKAFLALLLTTEMTAGHGGILSDDAVRHGMQALAAQRGGTAAQVYDNVFVPSVRSLKDAYNAYVAAQTVLVDEINAILEQQNRHWNDYLEGMAKRGVSLGKLTRAEWAPIVAEIRQAGVAVPADWNPTDKAAYVAALSAQRRKLADTQYADRLHRLFGTELPPGLEWDQFLASPIVQSRWRAAINAPADAELSPAMGFSAFEQAVYQPGINRVIAPKLHILLAPAGDYAPDGTLAPMGRAATLRIAAPAIALVLILAGLIWHGCGLAAYAARLVLPSWAWRRRCLALGLGLLGLSVVGARDPVTRSDGFNRMQDQIADRAGPAWLAALGMVEVYGSAYPWGELLRRTVLGHYDFGLDPFTGPKTDPQAALDRLLP